MINVIGLIVAVYALARLVQIPLSELPGAWHELRIFSLTTRLTAIIVVSAISGFVILCLAAQLLFGMGGPAQIQEKIKFPF